MKNIFVFLIIITIALLSSSACSRTDYYSLLSEKNIERIYLSKDVNSALSLDINDQRVTPYIRAITIPRNTDIASLIPSFEINGYALFVDGIRQTSGKTEPEITVNPDGETGVIDYTLYSFDGTKDEYAVNIQWAHAYFTLFALTQQNNPKFKKIDDPDTTDIEVQEDIIFDETAIIGNSLWFYLSHSLSINDLTPSYTVNTEGENAEVFTVKTVNDIEEETPVTSPVKACDFSEAVIFRVQATDGSYLDYSVSAYRLTKLSFSTDKNNFGTSVKEYEAFLQDRDITIQVPLDADLSSLIPDYTMLGDKVTFNGKTVTSGSTPVDFSSETPVKITVSTKTGQSHDYFVKVEKVEEPYNRPNNPISETEDTTDPGKVKVTSLATDDGSVMVTWNNPEAPDYDYAVVTCGSQSQQVTGIAGASSNCTFSSLSYGEYTMTITAYDDIDNGSAPVSFSVIVSNSPVQWHLIYTANDLNAVRGNESGYPPDWNRNANYQVMADIDLASEGYVDWEPITAAFAGKMMGNGHTITAKKISGITNVGIFSEVSGTLKEINVTVTELVKNTGSFTGILAGKNSGTIDRCTVSGSVSGTTQVGGLVGQNVVNGSITDSHSYGEVNGTDYVGGLVGYNNSSSIAYMAITNSSANGDVTGIASSVGGLVGSNGMGSITLSYATGDVSGERIIGGLVGNMAKGDISSCYATGDITGSGVNVGGLAGSHTSISSIKNCYARGTVNGADHVGGLVGNNLRSIENSYATGGNGTFGVSGAVGASFVGGLIGYDLWSVGIVTACFYDKNTTNQSGVNYDSIPKMTAEMKNINTFLTESWDFSATWSISPDINDGYPYLTALPPAD
ncbi:MAG: hypothetical protein PF637_13120 [Spirochaetes bacterium]|nr:hypothetical protein [Spirochaetota bacterium]